MIAFSGYVPTARFSEQLLTENDFRTIGNGRHHFSRLRSDRNLIANFKDCFSDLVPPWRWPGPVELSCAT
jgi:hypothetical protein